MAEVFQYNLFHTLNGLDLSLKKAAKSPEGPELERLSMLVGTSLLAFVTNNFRNTDRASKARGSPAPHRTLFSRELTYSTFGDSPRPITEEPLHAFGTTYFTAVLPEAKPNSGQIGSIQKLGKDPGEAPPFLSGSVVKLAPGEQAAFKPAETTIGSLCTLAWLFAPNQTLVKNEYNRMHPLT